MLTIVEITNKTGNAAGMANGQPLPFEVECVIDYSIDEGQREITNCLPENAQPGFPAQVEDVTLISATILYGKYDYPLTEESIWWAYVEDMLLTDGGLEDEILAYEEEYQSNFSTWGSPAMDDLKSIARLAQENEKLAKTDFGGSAFFGSKHQGETK